jgi:hypothetical protein
MCICFHLSLVQKVLCVGVFKVCFVCIFAFFNAIIGDFGRSWGSLQGNFVHVHPSPLIYLFFYM